MQEITLTSGVVVRCQAVPPMAVTEVVADHPDLSDPPIPYEQIEGIAGLTEAPAREGTDLYHEYYRERKRIEGLRAKLQDDFVWDYGVLDWKYPESKNVVDGIIEWKYSKSEFVDTPPKTWQFPQRIKDYGKLPRSGERGRRVDYIKYELLGTPDDVTSAQEIIYSIAPITGREVDLSLIHI